MSKKIVINACHGGFDFSWAAARRMAERKGLVASAVRLYGTSPADPESMGMCRVVGPRLVDAYPDGDDAGEFKSASDFARDDADLVAVVEELGEKASGPLSRLKIVEIPDGVEWTIEEYDGSEWVAEVHQTWQ